MKQIILPLSLVCSFFFTVWIQEYYQPEFNGGLDLAFIYLSLPSLALSYGIYRLLLRWKTISQRLSIFWLIVVLAVHSGLLTGLIGGPLVLISNSWLGATNPQSFSGPVISKWVSTYYKNPANKKYYVKFFAAELKRNVAVSISQDEYTNIVEGQPYSRKMYFGAFGILYDTC